MSIQAVIWDFGGVLVRTEDPAPRTALGAEVGLSAVDLERHVFASEAGKQAQLGAVDGSQYLDQIAGDFKLDPQVFRERFFGGDQLDETLMDYIHGLRPAYKTGLLSNAMTDLRELISDFYPIIDAFDSVTISSEHGTAKPDARIYEIALQSVDVSAAQAVFIDDAAENVAAAQALGMQAIHFKSREQALSVLSKILNQ